MINQIIEGIFVLFSGAAGAAITVYGNRKIKELNEAKDCIRKLTEQIAAYHKLESLYMQRASDSKQIAEAAVTIQRKMRRKVFEQGGFEYPSMTAHAARRIMDRWR